MPEGKDPDDFIKHNGLEGLKNLLKKKEIIQSFVWNYHLSKINQNDPYEISKFEKEIKKLSYSIKDETLKKYVLENFLEEIKKLTPIQTSIRETKYFNFQKKKEYKILKETKILHQRKKNLSKIQILEFSILYLILNFSSLLSKKLEELSKITFLSEKNEVLKSALINSIVEGSDKEISNLKINKDFKKILDEINENSNIQIIAKNKTEESILIFLDDLIRDYKDQTNLKKIESLEQKLINNLDENSYSELIKLKSQLNRE